ncbi:MAG: peptide chain release factor 1 [Phycisphaeraceae bacterium]|nr:peptide chain release factor 1 [Phycisphaeraceae bacterium]
MSDSPIIDRLEKMLQQRAELDRRLADPDVARDPSQVTSLSRKRAALDPLCVAFEQYKAATQEADDLQQMAAEESDEEVRQTAETELPEVRRKAEALLEKIKGDLVTTDDRTVGSVILELRAGTGGDEAALWTGDLLNMYQQYAATKGWKWEPMDFSGSDMGGYRQAVVNLSGEGVWMHLGYEGGTHCVKRVPATESQGRIHTSTATVAVLPEPEEVDVPINESDVKVDITTAQGPGGQNVNKVATAVKMVHLPTGIEVRMQETKSQHQNRQLAWQLLRARLHEHHRREAEAQRAQQRSEMIGTGGRSERIRTYRYKDNLVVDHRLSENFNLQNVLAGQMDPIIEALIELDKARRLAAL